MVVRMAVSHSFVMEVGHRGNRKNDSCYFRVLRIMPRELGWCISVSISMV